MSEKYTARGTLHFLGDTTRVSDRFVKREFVLELTDNPKYPQVVSFQATGDRCELLDGARPGDMVEVQFNLRGREWTSPKGETKFFTTLDAWKIDVATAPRQATSKAPPQTAATKVDDDLPF